MKKDTVTANTQKCGESIFFSRKQLEHSKEKITKKKLRENKR